MQVACLRFDFLSRGPRIVVAVQAGLQDAAA
jgi:hypothetical protein